MRPENVAIPAGLALSSPFVRCQVPWLGAAGAIGLLQATLAQHYHPRRLNLAVPDSASLLTECRTFRTACPAQRTAVRSPEPGRR